jgi:hypothetical protein
MSNLEIKEAIQNLSKSELRDLLDWLDDYREAMWDKQIEEDIKLGKLDHLISEAKKEFREGKCRQI